MSWSLFAKVLASTDLTSTNRRQAFTPNKNMVLRGIRTWILFQNDPVFTLLSAKLYSNESVSSVNTPRVLIASSTNSILKSQIVEVEDHGAKEVFFQFDDINLQSETTYSFVLSGVGYVPTDSSFLAWVQDYPDYVYTPTGISLNKYNLNRYPYRFVVIGADA